MKKTEFSFMYKPQYKEIIQNLQKGLKQVSQLVDYDSKEERIRETKEQIRREIQNDLAKFASEEKQRITKQKNIIEESYARSKNVYENPTEELLRRQDFDMEVAAMNEREIADMLKAAGRSFTNYELNKIYSLDIKDTEIKTMVKRAINENRHPYLKDVKYQKLVKEETELGLIDNRSLKNELLYLPANTKQGYTSLSLKGMFMNHDKHELSKNMDTLEKSLEIQPSDEIETFTTGLSQSIKDEALIEKPKKEYEDFDSRIFRGSKNFDIIDRFKYLEERFDDKKTDRFDKTKEDYSARVHMDFLEGQHAKKMASDPNYREAYKNAENEVRAQIETTTEKGESDNR